VKKLGREVVQTTVKARKGKRNQQEGTAEEATPKVIKRRKCQDQNLVLDAQANVNGGRRTRTRSGRN
jgi:hypothetical protein